jgi:hypothetical protein
MTKKLKSIFPIGTENHPPVDTDCIANKFSETDDESSLAGTYNTAIKLEKTTGIKWRYVTEEITYHINKNGLREKQTFDEDYDFSEKYVVLGCSFVKGIGVGEEHTISSYIEKSTGVRTYNFGNGGSGPDIVFYNAIWLAGLKNPPKKIFIVWPQTHRFSLFKIEHDKENNHFMIPGPRSYNVKSFLPASVTDNNMIEYRKYFTSKTMIEPNFQSGNKLLYQQILRSTWGSRLVELDLLDDSSYNQSYQGPEPLSEIKSYQYDKATPEEVLNDWLARDVKYSEYQRIATGRTNIGTCHFGPKVYEGLANWLLSQ